MGWMGLWWIVGLAALVALIWVIVRISGGGTRREDSPEAMLKRRYARGEIDRDEYQRRLEDVRK